MRRFFPPLFATVLFAAFAGLAASGLAAPARAAEKEPAVVEDAQAEGALEPARRGDRGVWTHVVKSPHQAGDTRLRVVLPDRVAEGELLPVVYVLPVEAGDEHRYGDGLREVLDRDLPNKHRAIFAAPTFSALPWYADHETDRALRQESHFTRVVAPLVEKHYPARRDAAGRLLLGFSKSGWGAWTLLLRHPEAFGRAAAWDAPLRMDRVGLYGNGPIFGSQANFERHRVTDLLRAEAARLRAAPRLILLGHGNFRQHHVDTHALLNELAVPHVYRDGPGRKHDWHSGWVAEAVELLLAPAK